MDEVELVPPEYGNKEAADLGGVVGDLVFRSCLI